MQQSQTSILAVVALVFAFVFWPLGLLLGIIALVRIKGSNGALSGSGLAITSIVLSLAMVVMMGILAAIAIPNFLKFQCKAKQSEAKGQLKSLMVAEESHRAETNFYDASFEKIGWQPRGQPLRYEYSVKVGAGKESFVATARGIGEMAGDVWTIDENIELRNVSDVCAR